MDNKIKMKGINSGSLFKLLFVGFNCSLGLSIIGFGIASLLGYTHLTLGENTFKGIQAFGITLLIAPLLSAALSSVFWFILGTGLWIWMRFKKIEIIYREY